MTIRLSNEEVTEAEQRRCHALLARDVKTLGDLLGDDLIHVHTNGQAETKQQYLASIAEKIEFLRIRRLSSDVRMVGEAAILCGRINQVIRVEGHSGDITLPIYATIIWQWNGSWRVVSFHATLSV